MNRLIIYPILFLTIFSCSLYQDKTEPQIYFNISDFDILDLGKTISDINISLDGNNIYLTDYNNNSLVFIKAKPNMSVIKTLQVGSHPIAIDLNSNGTVIAIALEGESNVLMVDTESMQIIETFSVSLMNMNDISFVNDTTLIISSRTDPSCATISINSGIESLQSVLNGELAMNSDDGILYVATNSSIKKYNWQGNTFQQDTEHISDPYGFIATVHHFIFDKNSNTLFTCLSAPDDQEYIQHVYSYHGSNLTFAGKYLIKSPGLGVAVYQSKIFTAPKDADESGVFVVEFDQSTKLEKNYYLSAGNLSSRGIVVDPNGEYIYVLINSPGDNDSTEPYNNFSFDLQKISIIE